MARRDSWQVSVLDRDEREKGIHLQARAGRLAWSTFRSVAGAGSLEATNVEGIDWFTDRIRITHVDGDQATPMGVWLLSTSGREIEGPVARTTLSLSDKTEALNRPLGRFVTYPTGTAVVPAVEAIIRACGETSMALTYSAATTTTALTWEPDATWLKVAGDLLTAIGYGPLRADMLGVLRAGPYLPPDRRPVRAVYGGESTDLQMRPTWSDEADLAEIPTGVRIIVSGDDKTPGLIGRADHPDAHPFSAASRGGERLRVETSEAVDQAAANTIAARFLDESSQVTYRATIAHPIDHTALDDVVHHRPAGLDAAIVERSVDLGVGAVVTDTVRHIYTGGVLPWQVRS